MTLCRIDQMMQREEMLQSLMPGEIEVTSEVFTYRPFLTNLFSQPSCGTCLSKPQVFATSWWKT